MMKLYVANTSNGQRPAVMLEECGLPYRAKIVAWEDLGKPKFLKLNPLGQIPVLVDPKGPGGKPLVLSQSAAIMLYAAEKSGKLLPKSGAARALTLQWFAHVLTDVAANSTVYYYVGSEVPRKTPSTTKFFKDRLVRFLGNCDRQLGKTDYLTGRLSIADVALYPTAAGRMSLIKKNGFANLQRWAAKMAARPTVQRGMKACG